MKLFQFIICILFSFTLIAQENDMPTQISAQGITINSLLNTNHKPDTLFLKYNKKEEGKLVLLYANSKTEANFKRTYYITDNNNQQLKLNFLSRIVGIAHVMLNDFFSQSKPGNTYNLYCTYSSLDNTNVKHYLLCKIKLK